MAASFLARICPHTCDSDRIEMICPHTFDSDKPASVEPKYTHVGIDQDQNRKERVSVSHKHNLRFHATTVLSSHHAVAGEAPSASLANIGFLPSKCPSFRITARISAIFGVMVTSSGRTLANHRRS